MKPVQGIRQRIARLDLTGATPAGANNTFVHDGFTTLRAEPEIRTGTAIETLNAAGVACVDRRDADSYRWWNVTLGLCAPTPEVLEMVAEALAITDGPDVVGFGVPKLGVALSAPGVSLETWTYNMEDGQAPDADFPYVRIAMPRTYGWTIGPIVVENGAQVQELKGIAIENPLWLNGPANDWTGPTGSDARAIMAVLDDAIPAAGGGTYSATPAQP